MNQIAVKAEVFQFHKGAIGVSNRAVREFGNAYFNSIKVRLE